ncbi:MAG: lipocalin [Planctomycetes bacterium SM23_32]|nr:MAG: lipocalin [Planctomycetes bacterium SM23_32]
MSAVGCMGPPKGLEPVQGFEPDRYLGTWYEIARLDHRFERGLSNVTASYSWRNDGAIRVVNRGYDPKKGKWRQAEAVARSISSGDVASLKVRFFWPFWGGYHVIGLDKQDYQHALVTSHTRSYLWILSRRPDLDEGTLLSLIAQARRWGFDTEALIYVKHDMPAE